VAILSLYAGLQLKTSSRYSFKLALAALFSTFLLAPTKLLLLKPLLKDLASLSSKLGEEAAADFFSNITVSSLLNAEFLSSMGILLPLLFFRKEFQSEKRPISSRAKKILLFLSVLFLPILAATSFWSLRHLSSKDYGYQKAQSTVSYHIYQADPTLLGLEVTLNFTPNQQLAGSSRAVWVAYGVGPQKTSGGVKKNVILKQVGVGENFDLSSFVTSQFIQSKKIRKISLKAAGKKGAYLIERTVGSLPSNHLVLVTPDNVLILISSIGVPPEQLTQLANSLY
jgi:hypothetical protein